jgi:hypothetical protein
VLLDERPRPRARGRVGEEQSEVSRGVLTAQLGQERVLETALDEGRVFECR